MALHPELVDLSRLPPEEDAELVGIGGEDPRQASMEFGQRAVEAIIKRLVEKSEELLK